MFAMWEQLNYQDALSPQMEFMINLNEHISSILILVLLITMLTMFYISMNTKIVLFTMENHSLEIIWTVLPGVILLFIAIPSLRVLYLTEENFIPNLSLKCIGHQWYWSYEYSDFEDFEVDSFMNKENTLRLMNVDQRVILPYNNINQLFVTSLDVLHSWAVPSLGLKADANPGRLNQIFMLSKMPGIYYGQCSELCGVNHSFMPIVIEFINLKNFSNWVL